MLYLSSAKIDRTWFAMVRDDQGKMVACAFSEDGRANAMKGVINSVPKRWRSTCKPAPADMTKFRELYELYNGQGRLDPHTFDLSHVSPFRRKVYRTLQRIPRGRVTTYGAIAKKIASRRHARAVGAAVGSNPLPLVVPCHRVVTASLEVINYGMPNHKPSEGAAVKRGLLEREGVVFVEGRPTRDCLWLYPS